MTKLSQSSLAKANPKDRFQWKNRQTKTNKHNTTFPNAIYVCETLGKIWVQDTCTD